MQRMRPLLPMLVVAAVLGAWLGLRAFAAQHRLEQARGSLTTARVALVDRRVDDARAAIEAATRDTSRARRLTGDPVWRVAAAVPLLGRSLQSVRGIAAAVDDVARQVVPPGLRAAEVLAGPELRTDDGAIDLGLVEGITPLVAQSGSRLRAVRDRLAGLPALGVVGPVRAERKALGTQLADLSVAIDRAGQVAALAPPLLGADRPRRYFVLVQQPGESRGTGGLPGGYAIVEVDQGRVRVTASGSNRDLKSGDIPVPAGVSEEYAYEYGGNLAFRLWSNVNLSPDLPMVAKVVAARWKAQGGQDVDGVIVVDPTSIADLLRGSDPVDVGGGKLVAPKNMVRFLTVDQYVGIASVESDQTERKDALAGAAQQAASRLSSGADDTGQTLAGLTAAVTSGHLRMASDDPALQPGLAAVGIDGALPRGEAPVAYAVVENASQGKLDSFLERHVTYTAGPCTGDIRASTIAVQLRNRAPARGLPPYLTNRDDDGVPRQSLDSAVLLQTYGSPGAVLQSAELNGTPVPQLDTSDDGTGLHEGLEAGLPFWSLYVNLPRDVPQVLTLHLEEPVVAGAPRLPEQPLVLALRRTVDAPICS